MNAVTHAFAGAFPLGNLRNPKSSARHRPWGKAADLFPILKHFRYSSASYTRVWDSIHAHNRNFPPEKVAHTLALSAHPRDRLVVIMPDNSLAIETRTDTSKAQSQVPVFYAFTSHTSAALALCWRYKILQARVWKTRFPRDLSIDSLLSSHKVL